MEVTIKTLVITTFCAMIHFPNFSWTGTRVPWENKVTWSQLIYSHCWWSLRDSNKLFKHLRFLIDELLEDFRISLSLEIHFKCFPEHGNNIFSNTHIITINCQMIMMINILKFHSLWPLLWQCSLLEIWIEIQLPLHSTSWHLLNQNWILSTKLTKIQISNVLVFLL